MPLHDWQFWLVTLLALWGLWALARTVVPARRRSAADGGAGCPNCAAGAASFKPKRRVAITIERRKV